MVTSLVTIRLRWLWFIYFDHCDQINISDIKNIIGINAWHNLSIFLIQKLRFKLIYNYNSNTLIRIYLKNYIYVYFAYTTFFTIFIRFFSKNVIQAFASYNLSDTNVSPVSYNTIDSHPLSLFVMGDYQKRDDLLSQPQVESIIFITKTL